MKLHWIRSLTSGDIILIIVILLSALAGLFLLPNVMAEGQWVVIEVNQVERYRENLSKNHLISVNGPIGRTIIEIENGKARVSHSDCREKICEKTGSISRTGELIVCVPNKVVIRIVGDEVEGQFNVITE